MILYLDCDTGIDDALAIALLLAHDEVNLAGIGTVGGNTSAAQGAANTLGLLALAGRDDIPVAAGGGTDRDARSVHGGNGVGEVVRGGIAEKGEDLALVCSDMSCGVAHAASQECLLLAL